MTSGPWHTAFGWKAIGEKGILDKLSNGFIKGFCYKSPFSKNLDAYNCNKSTNYSLTTLKAQATSETLPDAATLGSAPLEWWFETLDTNIKPLRLGTEELFESIEKDNGQLRVSHRLQLNNKMLQMLAQLTVELHQGRRKMRQGLISYTFSSQNCTGRYHCDTRPVDCISSQQQMANNPGECDYQTDS
ncbi:hypothetical protein FBU30_001612, partial [Linnemannia zychae]